MTRSARRSALLGWIRSSLLGLAAAGLGLASAHAQASAAPPAGAEAQPPVGPPTDGRRYTLFISPVGKPYRGVLTDPYPVAAWFAAADADHDGRVSRAEFRADAEAFFRELDRDHDGVIEPEEVAFYEKVMAPEIIASFRPGGGEGPSVQPPTTAASNGMGEALADVPVRDGRDVEDSRSGGNPDGEPPQGAAWFSFMGEPEPVTAADVNFDGKITLKQFLKVADERFTALDPNNRGYFVLADLPRTPIEAMGGQRRTPKKKR
jgi:hypothetical protein